VKSGFDSRQTRRMLDRMGVNLEEIPEVEEVVIRTAKKNIVVKNASVSEIKTKGMRVFQVMGEVEEKVKETPKYTEEDVVLVSQQAGVSREKALAALNDCDGDLARAILKLTT
jgi:nascent polypeptide-associated complex subunit alpha